MNELVDIDRNVAQLAKALLDDTEPLDEAPFDIAKFGALVEKIGSASFGETLLDFVGSQFEIDGCLAFDIPETGRPVIVIAEGRQWFAKTIRRASASYVMNDYRQDRNFEQLKILATDRSFFCGHFCDKSIESPEYREKFFWPMSLREKLSAILRHDEGYLYLNLYRSFSRGRLDDAALATADKILHLAICCLRQHVRFRSEPICVETRTDRLKLVYKLLDCEKESGSKLTARELDVCARIVVGYSTDAIGANLGITKNTVATHRKRAYYRLGIGGQNELFELCLKNIIRLSRNRDWSQASGIN